MGNQMSAGVEVNEIDLSIVVPMLGNATAAFAGVFTKGPNDKYLLITNSEELIQYYGMPTNNNYNDWFQCYNFLQYANKLLVSRAVDANGTFKDSGNTVYAVNELGKVEVTDAPYFIQVGSIVKFSADQENEYKVSAIETPVNAQAQVDTITVNTVADTNVYTVSNRGQEVSYTATDTDTTDSVATELGLLIENVDTNATNVSVTDSVITITASIAGVAMENIIVQGDMTLNNVTENIEGESYELVFEDVNGQAVDFTAVDVDNNVISGAVVGASVFVKYSAINAIVTAPKEGANAKTAEDLKQEAIFVPNEDEYEVQEMSIPVTGNTKLKFIAKSSGSLMNGIEIAIAREADFASGSQFVFDGIVLNNLFETKPLDSKKEIAVIVRQDDKITGAYIVSLVEGSKDYRNKSNYIEDIINVYDTLVYVKDNTAIVDMPDSRLYTASVIELDGTVTTPAVNKVLYMSNGTDGYVNNGDIEIAYGNVSDNTIFGNKEELDIDIVIANEQARVAAGTLASDRADCIAFIGAKFEDVVGLPSAKIVENLIADVMTGELNNSGTANSYCATFGNYKQQYDKFNDKMRWVSVAGDVAGLRADTNTSLNTWWASAGLDRGQIKNAQKIAFNPNLGQRDFLYKNKINPIVSFPGQGTAIVWGQKTLQSKPSAFDRINVRGLFNTLERSISRMAKYYLFEFNDGFTRNRFVGTIKPFLESVKAGRGVYDFYVRCDETNNTPAVIDANQFVCDIAVKPTRVAEFITLNFIATGTGVEFSEIFV
jgi:hypothetical protein